jgi:hypothetical protein
MARPALHCAGEINIKTNVAHRVDTLPNVGHDVQHIARSTVIGQPGAAFNKATKGATAMSALEMIQSKINRRSVLRGAIAAVPLVTVPAGFAAAAAIPLTVQEELNVCLEQLKTILKRMHPIAAEISDYLCQNPDGSFQLDVRADAPTIPFDGDGLYEVSINGWPSEVWLSPDVLRSQIDGSPIAGMEFYWAHWFEDGEYRDDPRRMYEPKILRKLEPGSDARLPKGAPELKHWADWQGIPIFRSS